MTLAGFAKDLWNTKFPRLELVDGLGIPPIHAGGGDCA